MVPPWSSTSRIIDSDGDIRRRRHRGCIPPPSRKGDRDEEEEIDRGARGRHREEPVRLAESGQDQEEIQEIPTRQGVRQAREGGARRAGDGRKERSLLDLRHRVAVDEGGRKERAEEGRRSEQEG